MHGCVFYPFCGFSLGIYGIQLRLFLWKLASYYLSTVWQTYEKRLSRLSFSLLFVVHEIAVTFLDWFFSIYLLFAPSQLRTVPMWHNKSKRRTYHLRTQDFEKESWSSFFFYRNSLFAKSLNPAMNSWVGWAPFSFGSGMLWLKSSVVTSVLRNQEEDWID